MSNERQQPKPTRHSSQWLQMPPIMGPPSSSHCQCVTGCQTWEYRRSKTFSHFSSSAKRIDELKSIHTFVEVEYQSLLRHVPTRWLSLWPAVKRLHDSWAPIKTYFLSLGEDQYPMSLWRLFKDDQDGEGNPLDLQVYLSFLSNALKIFHDTVLVLEREDGTIYECTPPAVSRQAAVLREDMCNFYQSSLTYLEQRYDFSDSNYQKKVASLALKKSPFNFSQLCEAVEVLQLSKKLDMDALYDEYCVVLPHQQTIVQSGAPVVEKWAILLKHTHTPNMTALASFLLSVPITNASVERVFSLMTGCWTDTRNRCSVNLIKSEIQLKSNFTFSCKDFYSYVVKEKVLLNAVRSNKKYKFKKKPEDAGEKV
ncbi:hypothetical protein DPEC_G00110080 [Dallia pectoralis]|uniref:Uncharacterized protein n=1 Tax=Dallia pectoralis TaxID=75939 RepID=A0ACC2GSW0_DALPE|nr:hypothetical protein DPEC_G00110080 [Dallia pectoralis]